MKIVRTENEVDEIRNEACEGMDSGSKYPGMTYEDGIDAIIRWLLGETDDHPFEE